MLESLTLSLQVTRRHWLVYKKDFWANSAPTLAEPIFFILSFGVGLGAYLTDIEGRSYVTFLAPGLAMTSALFTSFFESTYNLFIRKTYEGIYDAILTTPIGVREIIFGELIWVTLKGAVFSIVTLLTLLPFANISLFWLWAVPLLGGLVAFTCGSLSIVSTSFVNNINQFQTIYTFLIAPMFFFSGVFFPADELPTALQKIVQISPVYHGVRLSQFFSWNEIVWSSFAYHAGVLSLMATVLGILAYRQFYKMLYK